MDKILKLFHSKKNEIEKFKEADSNLLKDISNSVFEILNEKGLLPKSKYGDKLKAKLKEINIFTNYIKIGVGGSSIGTFQHTYNISIPIYENSNEDFKT